MRDKIIIASNDDKLRMLLNQFLSSNGFEVLYCSTACQSAVALIRANTPDLILIDMLSTTAGLELCTEIRRFSDRPLLWMGSQMDDEMRIFGLNAGCDDYISKPINTELLLAQVRAQIRRYRGAFAVNQRHLLIFPGLEIDLSTKTVTSYGHPVVLSAKEFQLLVLLAKHPNRVFDAEALYDLIWSDNKLGDLRTVMVHIYNLRQKIEKNPRDPLYIHTVRGAGYKFNGRVAQRSNLNATAIL